MSLIINGKKLNLNNNKILSIIQLCESLNIYIPRFCYHKKLSIAGNCRMCLVEIEFTDYNKKMVIACGTTLVNNWRISTYNLIIKKVRENILEFLLINHPLDCPICDQGGECDLQDQVLIYGNDRHRFTEKKRTVNDKNFGVFIKAIMTRCIHCTRCIRFFDEIVGSHQLGLLGRGMYTEVGTYTNKFLESEITGNIIDLCPVGALTSKPFSFSGRSWEFMNIESIDILDSTCSSIRIDIKGNIIMRIVPVINNKLNEEWITDKIRFCYDSFKLQRIVLPYVKLNRFNKYIITSYERIYSYIKININIIFKYKIHDSCTFFIGDLINVFSQIMFKFFSRFLGFYNLNSIIIKDIDQKQYYLMNEELNNIETYKLFLLCGINTKVESSILNIKLKKVINRNNNVKVCYIGTNILLNYDIIHLGFTCELFLQIYFGKFFICKTMFSWKKICCIGNSNFFSNENSFNTLLLSFFKKLNININYNYVTLFSSEINSYELGIQPSLKVKLNNNWWYYSVPKFIYLLGVDWISKINVINNNNIIIYQGHHADNGSFLANIILPSSTYIENEGHYISCEGILKYTPQVLNTYAKILPDSIIIYSLLQYISNTKLYNYNNFVHYIKKIYPNRLNKTVSLFNLFDMYSKYEYIYFYDNYYINRIKSYYALDVFNRNSTTIVKYLISNLKNKINFF